MTLKRALREALPAFIRRRYDRLRLELPFRIRDFPLDFLDRVRRPTSLPVPPAWLRAHIGRTSSRDEYLRAGRGGFEELLSAFHSYRDPAQIYPRWLDFGCGCARMCRYLPIPGTCESFVGIDVDEKAIRWNRRHVPGGEFILISARPPTPLPEERFDVIYAASVFTHLDEAAQLSWLEELSRLLRPAGLLLASTHSDTLAYTRPDLSPSQVQRLEREGFVFARGGGSFNDDTAFHSRSYLERHWTGVLRLRGFHEHGLFHFQDLSVWEKIA